MKQQHLLHDFLFMHTNTAIYTAVILKASQFSSACIQELKQLIPVYPDLQIGISSVQKAAKDVYKRQIVIIPLYDAKKQCY